MFELVIVFCEYHLVYVSLTDYQTDSLQLLRSALRALRLTACSCYVGLADYQTNSL
jgi:hypothetical protein